MEGVAQASSHMDRGGAQAAMKVVVMQNAALKKNFSPFPAAQLRHTPA
jgi:hypothetical protein